MPTGAKVVFIGFAVVAGYYLMTEHAAHVLTALPLLLFLSCPIMHLFMHHGHNHGRTHAVPPASESTPEKGGDNGNA
ncbi:hypothetical protein NVSP9465_04064 [Novosphingobium sp. CECT 9465]|nr:MULTISPECIES: DUF2933 domain-containing protein [Sphingomonadaceae]CAH0498968.1 hypothetical protein NVSP9465_04064 [Novosphingobium sp. CECT 9465]